MTNMFKPKIPAPSAPAAPPPTPEAPKALEMEGTSERARTASRSKGRKGLKIDLQAGIAGGTGINVPRA